MTAAKAVLFDAIGDFKKANAKESREKNLRQTA
jgi:hypothetical protein